VGWGGLLPPPQLEPTKNSTPLSLPNLTASRVLQASRCFLWSMTL